MQGRCAKHLFESAEDHCGKCGEEFCGECLVYAFGPKKPPYCIPCAVAAAGIRASAGNRPVVGKSDLKRLEKERKSAMRRWRRERKHQPEPVLYPDPAEPAVPAAYAEPEPVMPAAYAEPEPVMPAAYMPDAMPDDAPEYEPEYVPEYASDYASDYASGPGNERDYDVAPVFEPTRLERTRPEPAQPVHPYAELPYTDSFDSSSMPIGGA